MSIQNFIIHSVGRAKIFQLQCFRVGGSPSAYKSYYAIYVTSTMCRGVLDTMLEVKGNYFKESS